MKSAEELRAEAHRLRMAAANVSDPAIKQELAARAVDLSLQAEEIARSRETPEVLRMNIERYKSMLAAGIADEQQKRVVEGMLHDAQEMLAQLTRKP